jgi:hypothetical protein
MSTTKLRNPARHSAPTIVWMRNSKNKPSCFDAKILTQKIVYPLLCRENFERAAVDE